ncbi:MAG: MmcQ/YjbR family DNA-binding protein [Actinobacteria bacterium]|nr:MmcQ/YjbR family DNA-binding protein [Actinomycetota bacterium]MCI0677912.1 MmcQ/YjbR family DNA-binding protein [Actinomycetota bacterium]
MDAADVRRLALSLPEASEEPHFEMTSFRVRGKIFATMPPDAEHLHVFVDEDETQASVSDDSEVFEELWWGKRLVGLRVHLASADREHVSELLQEAWRQKAPKRLAANLDRMA